MPQRHQMDALHQAPSMVQGFFSRVAALGGVVIVCCQGKALKTGSPFPGVCPGSVRKMAGKGLIPFCGA